jgi:hypothetical protein
MIKIQINSFIRLLNFGLSLLLFSGCNMLPSIAPTPSFTPTYTQPSPCPVSTQTPRFLIVQPIPATTQNSALTLDIHMASVENNLQNAISIEASESLGATGALRIETTDLSFNRNRIELTPGVQTRITVTVEFEDRNISPFPDANGRCVLVTYKRTIQTRSDINGRSLLITYLPDQPTPLVLATPAVKNTVAITPIQPTPITTSTPPKPFNTPAPPSKTSPPLPTRPPCVANASFISDVTFPNQSKVPPLEVFTKIWRVRNSGTCDWDNSFLLVPVGGNNFGLNQPVVLPNIANGAIADLAIELKAPNQAGTYTGLWRLQAPNGRYFGPTLRVNIIVPGSRESTPAPTATRPSSVCEGSPILGFFEARRITPNSNTFVLEWGQVNNADRVEIDNGIGVVKAPGRRNVTILRDTVYRLSARCGTTTLFREIALTLKR